MNDDASTAYICIYCPFNSDNLEALETHLTNAHEHGYQDASESPSPPNSQTKATKREASDEFQSSFDGTEGVKRVKRTSSPRNLSLNSSDETSDIDERDSSNFDRLHQLDLAESNRLPEQLVTTSEITACPYCDFKTHDIELFKTHIIDHIRDKNYRCLLCNRLYKYRGDCSFHIRRKHHRFSVNSNDYIQRFLFDTTNEGDESTNVQSISNHSTNSNQINREQEEPVRYFGCPYCDYTSNYGGDVRKHQARKHPNAESKVVKIIRQDSEILNSIDDDNESQTKIKSDKFHVKQSSVPLLPNFAPVRVFECSSCHQQGTYKWVVERHIRAKHPDQGNVHVIELPAELSVKMQKISPPLKRFRCSLCPLQSKHSWVVIRHIKHFHTLQTASVLDIQPDGKPIQNDLFNQQKNNNDSINPDSDLSSTSESYHEDEHLTDDSMFFIYKCSLCTYQSNQSLNIQKHLNEKHVNQSNAYMITQYRSKTGKFKNDYHRSLSPTSALAKAKFSPVIEQALLSLQTSKLHSNIYAIQPKFGIKRLKCRHCFYRSNWKTDMIRHVRIRHHRTEPDHNKDMIIMSEQEARSTIELYENTFGKELRRRTFRTWNDWTKAEQEFTPKDGSLQYINTTTTTNNNKMKSLVDDESEQNTDELISLPNPSNIVSRLLLTTSPPIHQTNDDIPLDLSLKSSSISKQDSLIYLCSICSYKHSNRTNLQEHRNLHLTGQGLICPHCSYVTSTDYLMKEHFSKTHLTSHYPRKFASPIINQTADILEHDDEEFDIDSSDDEHHASNTSQNLYDCPVCSPSIGASLHFHNLEQLTHHILSHHHHQSCPFCSFIFHSKSMNNLIEHVKHHFNGTLVQPDPIHGIEQVKELCMLD